jgi:hypothetical protein
VNKICAYFKVMRILIPVQQVFRASENLGVHINAVLWRHAVLRKGSFNWLATLSVTQSDWRTVDSESNRMMKEAFMA